MSDDATVTPDDRLAARVATYLRTLLRCGVSETHAISLAIDYQRSLVAAQARQASAETIRRSDA